MTNVFFYVILQITTFFPKRNLILQMKERNIMKKAKIFLMLALSTALIFSGCGQNDSNEVLSPDDIVQTGQAGTESEEGTASTETEEAPELTEDPPAEGMVKSSLSGLWVDEEVAAARPIAVMFPTDKGSQPQYGIGIADVLYECMEEGEMSRQMGVIENWQDLEKIGNIRSGRDYYGYWAMEWDAIFVHWGGPYYLTELTLRDEFENLTAVQVGADDHKSPAVGGGAFWRSDPSNPTIHNGYTDGASLAKAMKSVGYDAEHRDRYYEPEHFSFAPITEANTLEDAPGSFDATKLDLSEIFPTTRSSLEYDEEAGVYYKFLYGNAQIDKVTGEQLAFENVIVQHTAWEYRPDNKYLKFKCVDNTMDGYYFTNGKGIHITWEKESDYATTRYYDDNGNEIKLNPGKTFIAIAQEGRTVDYE